MPIDNFELIRPLLHFELGDDFYFAEIIQRGKDIGKSGEHCIKDYRIHNFKQYESLSSEIKDLCDHFHARCYLRLNQRNTSILNSYLKIEMEGQEIAYKNAVRKFLLNGCDQNKIVNFPKVSSATKLYASVMGKYSSEPHDLRKWIIDVDKETESTDVECLAKGFRIQIENVGGEVLATIPSRTGLHIITHPFNVQEFCKWTGMKKEIVNTDGNTNLYIGD